MTNNKRTTKVIFAALFAALISTSCFIQIPLPVGIPIVLQDMFAILSGMLLGPIYGGIAVIVFFILGSIGLPVFSGKAGLHVLIAGPTCGFLWGYFLAAVLAGLMLKIFLPNNTINSVKSYIIISLVALFATLILFACGIIGFMIITKYSFGKSVAAVLIPFIPGNFIKLVLIVLLVKKFKPIIKRYL